MKKEICKIQLNNHYFDNKILTLFPHEKRLNLIFGPNGSGKTTLGRAIYNIKENQTNNKEAKFLDKNKELVNISLKDKSNIFVFNEDFKEKNLLFKDRPDQLNAIVIFGEEVKKETDINILENEKNVLQDKITKLNNLLKPNNQLSPVFIYEQIKKHLSKNWLKEQKEILNDPSITLKDEDIQKVIKTKCTSFNHTKYNSEKKDYQKLLKNTKFLFNPESININTIDEKHYRDLLT